MAILCPVTKAIYLDSGDSTISRHADYFKPLHVDCSVEYELPSCAKPPSHSSESGRREPLLMIHPSYYRREESRHRDPFVINLPTKLRSLEDWKTPTKTTKSRTVTANRNLQHRKRMLDSSPSTCSSNCVCGNSQNRPLPSFTSNMSKYGCPCGQVHQPMAMEPIDATMWSNCGVTIEDLRTNKRMATTSSAIDSGRTKSDCNNNDWVNGSINGKFCKLRRLQTYFEAKGSSKGVAAPNSFGTVAHSFRNRDIGATHSEDVYDVPIKRSKKDTFSTSSYEYCPDPYHHPLTLYEPQPAVTATPPVVPMTSHLNYGGYYRAAGTNAISTIVRGSENMWRLFQV